MKNNEYLKTHKFNTNTEKIEKSIGIVMRIGVSIAAIIMVVGIIMFAVNQSPESFDDKFSFAWMVQQLLVLNPYAIMALGIFVLILTPVIRVVSSIILFAYEKDKLYTAITTIVLIILIISFSVGLLI